MFDPATLAVIAFIQSVLKFIRESKGPTTAMPSDGQDVFIENYRVELPTPSKKIQFDYFIRKGNCDTTLVFFHGFGSRANDLIAPGLFSAQKYRDLHPLFSKRPHILSFSFGRSWLALPLSKRKKNPEWLTTQTIAEIIAHLSNKHELPTRRVLMGRSMGGFNAIQMFVNHPEMWAAALFHNPMIIQESPWNYFNLKLIAAPILRAHIDKKEWASVDPFAQLFKLNNTMPPCQFQIAKQDQFNLFIPGESLALSFKERIKNTEIIKLEGKHDDFDPPAAASFFNRFLL